jgi:UDP-hydrolysing UDP-N-acetyl-D-glucosamine 2-epimerase
MTRKVCVVITARPSYSRIRTALEAIRDHSDLELQLVVAASALLDRYGNALSVIEEEGFKVDRQVYMILEGENLVTSAKSTGFGLAELATVFDNLKPDMVVTIADRFETMATAVAAAYMNIPVVHIQGGEITGSIDEKVRHAVTKLADLHLVSSQNAAERVIRMGEEPDQVFVTGCPSIDLAREARSAEPRDIGAILSHYGGVGSDVDVGEGYVVVLQHPVTTEYQAAREHVTETLMAIREGQYPTLWFWPNVDAGSDGTSKGIRAFRETHPLRRVHFYKNMKPLDFLSVLMNSRCIIGNSSVAIRECAYLGVPAVNIGSRQQGRDRGRNVVDVGYDRHAIGAAIDGHWKATERVSDPVYGEGDAGIRIADVLATAELKIEKRLTY